MTEGLNEQTDPTGIADGDDLTRAVRRLADHVKGLRGEVVHERQERHRDRRKDWLAVLLVIAAVVVGAGIAIAWNRHDIARSERQWCGTLTILTQPTPAPTSDRGRDSLRELIRLRDSFGCEPMAEPASG